MKEKWIPGYSGYIPADRGSDDFCLSILLWMMTGNGRYPAEAHFEMILSFFCVFCAQSLVAEVSSPRDTDPCVWKIGYPVPSTNLMVINWGKSPKTGFESQFSDVLFLMIPPIHV